MVRQFLTRSPVIAAQNNQIVYPKPRQPIVVNGARLSPLASRNALLRLVTLPGWKSADKLAERTEGLGGGLIGVRKRPLLITVNPGTCRPVLCSPMRSGNAASCRFERR